MPEGPHPAPVPLLVVLSGPSGVGKDAVLSRMKAVEPSLHYAVTVTTRPQRPGERNGVDYYFVTKEEFQGMQRRGEFLEQAIVYGYLYGVPRRQIEQVLKQGQSVIIKADVQGAATIKSTTEGAILVFLAPPSLQDLEERLRQRKTESGIDFKRRIETARREMESLPVFDYQVVNYQDRVDEAVAQIRAILTAEGCRLRPRQVRL